VHNVTKQESFHLPAVDYAKRKVSMLLSFNAGLDTSTRQNRAFRLYFRGWSR